MKQIVLLRKEVQSLAGKRDGKAAAEAMISFPILTSSEMEEFNIRLAQGHNYSEMVSHNFQ